MSSVEAGDRIDIGNGRLGFVTKVSSTGLLSVSWDDGTRGVIVPDGRAHVEHGYFARLVADAQSAESEARSDAARRGWATRRAAALSG